MATISPPPVARLGPEVHDPVGELDDVEVVLDEHERVAPRRRAVEHRRELADVLEVQPVVGSSMT
jgi:hypothetical protein